ncbi:hypothetical protein Tco_1311925 [Tanacetum coccineum]
MHTRASNSELVESLLEPERTLNQRHRRRNRRVPFNQRNNPPKNPRIVYPPILDINNFHHFLVTLENLFPMDDEPMWAADHVVAPTPGSAITIPETANEFAIKGNAPKLSWSGNIIKIFYYGLSEITQEVLNAATGGIFLYKTLNQAYQLLEDKVLLKLDWAKNQKAKTSLKKTVAFADEDTLSVLGKFDGKSDEGFLVGYSLNSKAYRVYNLVTKRVEVNLHVNFLEDKPNVKGVGYRWMFDIDYLTDSMNYIPVSLENQANPHAGTSEVTNSAGTSQTPNANASEEKDEDAELIVVPSAVKNTVEKVETRKSSTNSKKEEILTEPQQEKEASSTGTSEDNPKILAFRRELEEIAQKHLGTVPENKSTSTPSVNSGSLILMIQLCQSSKFFTSLRQEFLMRLLMMKRVWRNLKRFLKLYKMTVGFKPCKRSCYSLSCNRYTANYHLYHALMEALIADEDAMDKEVADKVKDHKRKHDSDDDEDDDDDEGPSAGSNQGRSTKRRRSDSAASGSAKPPPKADDQSSKKPRESEASASKQHPTLSSTGWQITDTREAGVDSSMHRSDPESEHSEQSSDDISMQDEGNDSDMEDTDNAHIPKVSTTTWFKPIPESERPATPEPEWTIPPNDFPEPEHNWANAYATTYKVPDENKLQRKTYDIGSFIKWFCRRTGKKKLCKADLEGPTFNLVTKSEKLPYPYPSSKALRYLDFGLEELVPSLWVESEREYDISAVYGITHWWFRRKEFYINKHSESSDREAVRSQMRILSVISISEKDFKNLHPNDFEDLFPSQYSRKAQPSAQDRQDQSSHSSQHVDKKPGDQESVWGGLHSDGTLTRVMEKLDQMVKDFHLLEYNKGMETRKWSEDDKRRSKDFITAIEKRLQIKRIYRSLESFVGGRIRDIDYRLINRTT